MSSSPDAPAPRASGSGAAIAIVGIVLQGCQVIALVAGLFLLVNSYSSFVAAFDGQGDLEPLKAAAMKFLLTVALALGGCVLGILMIMYAAIRCRYRAPWFHKFLVAYGWYMIVSPPLTPLGVWMTWYAKTRRKEFEAPEQD
ncbi:MAG: hypothetical protein RL095_2703 [Verrucomicrobiota bacterium]|jgi:hypothetical protein